MTFVGGGGGRGGSGGSSPRVEIDLRAKREEDEGMDQVGDGREEERRVMRDISCR